MDVQGIVDRLVSHALASGLFERVNGHEPKAAPGNRLTAAVWSDIIRPWPPRSGLAVTSIRLVMKVRLYSPFIQEPQDAIDPNLVSATAVLMTAYSGDFDLGGTVANIDLLGATDGVGLAATAGYLNLDGKLYRVIDITVPMVLNDVFTQAP